MKRQTLLQTTALCLAGVLAMTSVSAGAQTTAVAAEAEAAAGKFGGSIVLKVRSRHIAHKTEAGGVKVGVPTVNVRAESEAMLARVHAATGRQPDGLLVQEMVTGGLEMILGLVRDPQLGPAILLGMGGVTAELTGDTAVRLLPITHADAEAMIAELKTAKLLYGYRGSPPRDVSALIAAILSFAAMARSLGDNLLEAEINPLFVLPDGQGVKAADGLAVFK